MAREEGAEEVSNVATVGRTMKKSDGARVTKGKEFGENGPIVYFLSTTRV